MECAKKNRRKTRSTTRVSSDDTILARSEVIDMKLNGDDDNDDDDEETNQTSNS